MFYWVFVYLLVDSSIFVCKVLCEFARVLLLSPWFFIFELWCCGFLFVFILSGIIFYNQFWKRMFSRKRAVLHIQGCPDAYFLCRIWSNYLDGYLLWPNHSNLSLSHKIVVFSVLEVFVYDTVMAWATAVPKTYEHHMVISNWKFKFLSKLRLNLAMVSSWLEMVLMLKE